MALNMTVTLGLLSPQIDLTPPGTGMRALLPTLVILSPSCVVQVADESSQDCAACHSIDASEGEFRAPGGATSPAHAGVGAHYTHLAGGMKSVGMGCIACHPVPDSLDDPGHIDGPPVEVRWGEVARTDGVAQVYDGSGTCLVWCHGAGLDGGRIERPRWTIVDGSQIACGSCHGLPPPDPHPDDDACETCHDASIILGEDGPEVAVPELHMNGEINLHPE